MKRKSFRETGTNPRKSLRLGLEDQADQAALDRPAKYISRGPFDFQILRRAEPALRKCSASLRIDAPLGAPRSRAGWSAGRDYA